MRLLDFDTLSFDCYGTLIDWETGLLEALGSWPGENRGEGEILAAFARHESAVEVQSPGRLYPEVLAEVHRRLAAEWCLHATSEAAEEFGVSVSQWPAFEDSSAALKVLKEHFRLVILSNIDRRSFRASQQRLGIEFDEVHTAEDIGSYKPDRRNFEYLLARRAENGLEQKTLLHTAQSLFHDHVPAKQFGLTTCWIDRRHAEQGWGATQPPPFEIEADFRFPNLRALADAVVAEAETQES